MEYKDSYHTPVLYKEVIDGLNIKPNSLIVDGTLGGGGHTKLILEKEPTVKVIAIDRDAEALTHAKSRLKDFKERIEFVHSNFKNIKEILEERGLKADGVLLDLGVSSHQIDDASRGFSFRFSSDLDMRMNQNDELTAKDVVNDYKEEKLVEIFSRFGEEKFSKRIARAIVSARPINRTDELKAIIEETVNKINKKEAQNSVQRVFQAIRIEVNSELDELYECIVELKHVLNKNARIAIITFHSLEDRIVKSAFQEMTTDCICPPKFPICVCGHKAVGKLVNRKPIVASEEERKDNSRSTCAKLRILEII